MTDSNVSEIRKSLKDSGIKSILIVDDALNLPIFDDTMKNGLYYLLDAVNSGNVKMNGIISSKEAKILTQYIETNYGNSRKLQKKLIDLYKLLFEKYIMGEEIQLFIDYFDRHSTTSVTTIRQLVKLFDLSKTKVKIQTLGTNVEDINKLKCNIDLILMDYYLEPHTGKSEINKVGPQGKKSLKLLRNVIELFEKAEKDIPSILLISSEDLSKTQTDYFNKLLDDIIAVQFNFLHKNWISDWKLSATDDAKIVLTELFNTFRFGRAMNNALNTWVDGARTAIDELFINISNLHAKDFAYLKKFRLNSEGISFANYIEWLLGESIRSLIDERVKWKHQSFKDLENRNLTKSIKGAHPPLHSEQITKIFNKIRFNEFSDRTRSQYSMGDIFLNKITGKIRMIISPDCDLVFRINDKTKKYETNATNLLSVGGDLVKFDEQHAFVEELIILEGNQRSINWNKKDITSHKISGKNSKDFNRLWHDGRVYIYHGTIRPLFAKKIQMDVLSDLSRVGVDVPPTASHTCNVSAYIQLKTGEFEAIPKLPESHVNVFWAQKTSQNKEHFVLLREKYVHALFKYLNDIDSKKLSKKITMNIDNLTSNLSLNSTYNDMLSNGIKISKNGRKGICIIPKKDKEATVQGWLKFVLDF